MFENHILSEKVNDIDIFYFTCFISHVYLVNAVQFIFAIYAYMHVTLYDVLHVTLCFHVTLCYNKIFY